MRSARAIAAMGAVAMLTATAAHAGEPVRPGESSMLNLGLWGPKVPAALKAAKAAPYAKIAGDCAAIRSEIEALDAVLGPDADQPAKKVTLQNRAGKLLNNTVRGFIPHRDVVRFVTGAGKQEKALTEAAMAGWARRGFLKGLEVSANCPGAAPVEAPSALEAATPVVAEAPVQLQPIAPAEAGGKPVLVRTFVQPTQLASDRTLAR